MEHGPVEAAFTVYSDFENYAGGIYHATSTKSLGGHAIRIVGWGVEGGVKYVYSSFLRSRGGAGACHLCVSVCFTVCAATDI